VPDDALRAVSNRSVFGVSRFHPVGLHSGNLT
jgi:hypothetical protein